MSTLELENIKHPDNSGDNIALASNGSITIDRKSTDGKVIVFRKDGTNVGSIDVEGANLSIDGGANKVGLQFRGAEIRPRDNGVAVDGTVDFGNADNRFKDLYLSGGVYLGGTGAANKLDDYEEGTWEPTIIGTSGNPTVTYQADNGGSYTKIGRVVYYTGAVRWTALSGGSGTARIGNLPFTSAARTNGDNADSIGSARTWQWNGTSNKHPTIIGMVAGDTTLTLVANASTGVASTVQISNLGTTCAIQFTCIAYV
jgi:hypothetical protein